MEAGLAEADDDTDAIREIKNAMKALLDEDGDELFDFLDQFSSRTFTDLENEEEINRKLGSLPISFQDKWKEGGYRKFSDLEAEFQEETERLEKKVENVFSLKRKPKKVLSKIRSSEKRIISYAQNFRDGQMNCSEGNIDNSLQSCRRKYAKAKKSGSANRKVKQSAAKRSCIEAAFSELSGDTDVEESVKNDMEGILTEDIEEGFDFLGNLEVNLDSPGVCCDCKVGSQRSEAIIRTKRDSGQNGQIKKCKKGQNYKRPRSKTKTQDPQQQTQPQQQQPEPQPQSKPFPASFPFRKKHIMDDQAFGLYENILKKEEEKENILVFKGKTDGMRQKYNPLWKRWKRKRKML